MMIDFDEMEKVRRAATQGNWFHYYAGKLRKGFSAGNPVNEVQSEDPNNPIVFWTGFDRNQSKAKNKANAKYIATFDPPTMKELLRLAKIGYEQRLVGDEQRPISVLQRLPDHDREVMVLVDTGSHKLWSKAACLKDADNGERMWLSPLRDKITYWRELPSTEIED